ncbi:MAG: sigma-70 family RNA polymerase sigma factor [Polyangiaceae bacterium]
MPPSGKSPSLARHHLRVVAGGATGVGFPALEDTEFDSVFRRFSPYVASIGLRLLGRDDELDDLVQDVFLEAHRGLSRVREPAAIKGWLARICVRRAVRRLRRRRLRAFLSLDTLCHDPELVAPGASPEARAEVSRLYGKLERLPALERVVWVLRYLEGNSLEEIATVCACSKSTVQRRLRDADTVLKESRT